MPEIQPDFDNSPANKRFAPPELFGIVLANMSQRSELIHDWLHNALGYREYRLTAASEDASFRRYLRLTHDNHSTIIMDAPPEFEDCRPFVHVQQILSQTGVHVPGIIAADVELGLLQLEDLGSTQYLAILNESNVDRYYRQAIDALARFQRSANPVSLPPYDEKQLRREMSLFQEWLLDKHLGIKLQHGEIQQLEQTMKFLVDNALMQTAVFVHRDYHSRNLMVCKENNPGIIDFQDAVLGPVSYDLVSLLKDCYIKWPRDKITGWVEYYLEAMQLDISKDQFLKWFDLMGVQRHMKASGIFARLKYRDNKPGFIADIPRTLSYISDLVPEHPQLEFIGSLITGRVQDKLAHELS